VPLTLDFSASYRYKSLVEGIEVPVTLHLGGKTAYVPTKLDTGATFCVFERWCGETLGLDIEAGRFRRFRTAAGNFVAFEHEVDIDVLGIAFCAHVFFAQDRAFDRSVLGRNGWINRLRIGLVDYDQMLYLSRYDE